MEIKLLIINIIKEEMLWVEGAGGICHKIQKSIGTIYLLTFRPTM